MNQITNDLEDTLKDKTDSEKQELQQTISQNKSKKKNYSKDTLTNEQKFHFVHKELSDKELPAKDKSKEDYEIDF